MEARKIVMLTQQELVALYWFVEHVRDFDRDSGPDYTPEFLSAQRKLKEVMDLE